MTLSILKILKFAIHKWKSMEYWWIYKDLEKIEVLRQISVPLSLYNEHPTRASMGLNPGFCKVYFKIAIFTACLHIYIYIYIYIYICVCVCVCVITSLYKFHILTALVILQFFYEKVNPIYLLPCAFLKA